MNALKFAVALAIGFGAANAASAGPPDCSGCPKANAAAKKADVTKAGIKLISNLADLTGCSADAACPAAKRSEAPCPTAQCPATCIGPGSACCEKMDCCEKTAAVDAPAPTTCSLATCSAAVPATAVAVCSASSDAAPPSPAKVIACSGEACPLSVCGTGCPTAAAAACSAPVRLTITSGPDCTACVTRLNQSICKQFTTAVAAATDCTSQCASQCAAECVKACGTACRGAACDGGPCPDGVCGASVCDRATAAQTAVCAAPICESSPCTENAAGVWQCDGGSTGPAAEWTAAPALAAPYPIAYEPPGLYGVQRTAAVETRSPVAAAAYAVPVPPQPSLPIGTWKRTLNDQSVTVAVAADGAFTATCTVPQAGCSLKITGDCRATADGLLFGVVTSAKVCPRGSGAQSGVDPIACVEVETFCRSLIDQPFSARCRVTHDGGAPSMTVSHALFGGIGFVGTPMPGDPAHLALTMFSGAYEAE